MLNTSSEGNQTMQTIFGVNKHLQFAIQKVLSKCFDGVSINTSRCWLVFGHILSKGDKSDSWRPVPRREPLKKPPTRKPTE